MENPKLACAHSTTPCSTINPLLSGTLSVQSRAETDPRCAASCLIERLADPNLMQAAGSHCCNTRGVSLPAGAVTPLRLAVAEAPTGEQLHTRIQILQTLLHASNGFSRSSGPDGFTAIQVATECNFLLAVHLLAHKQSDPAAAGSELEEAAEAAWTEWQQQQQPAIKKLERKVT